MQNNFYVESPKGIGNSPVREIGSQVWYRLQELKEEVTQELLDEGPLCQGERDDVRDDRALAGDSREIEWHHRSQLEARLRDITDAQDRLVDGNYGKCIQCGEKISAARLAADPATSLCLSCQKITEAEPVFHTL